jgi:uncharacterized membrane protein
MTRLRVERVGRGGLFISGFSWRQRLAAGIVSVAILGGGLALAATWPHPETAVLGTLVVYMVHVLLVVVGAKRLRRRRDRAASVNARTSSVSAAGDVAER